MPPEQKTAFSIDYLKFLPQKHIILTGTIIVLVVLYYFFASAPNGFPSGKTIHVGKGSSATTIAEILGSKNVIRSPFFLKTILLFSGQTKDVVAGDYLFSKPIGIFTVALRITTGGFDLTPVRITIPEGFTILEISKLFGNNFYNFDRENFLKLTEKKEGYLFPDTYFIFPNATNEEIIKIMEDNFNKKLKEHENEIISSGKKLSDIIIMASIIERETKKPEDEKIVSGILWKRLLIKMPLQVDAPFAYISNKSTYELTASDLKQNSPYNTYNRLGFPPTAIGNPGIEAILAAAYPEQSPYLYYLSDRAGNMHYAVNFEEHKRNKERHINKY